MVTYRCQASGLVDRAGRRFERPGGAASLLSDWMVAAGERERSFEHSRAAPRRKKSVSERDYLSAEASRPARAS